MRTLLADLAFVFGYFGYGLGWAIAAPIIWWLVSRYVDKWAC